MIWPRPISPTEACAVSAAAASLRPRKAETSRSSSPASARFSSIDLLARDRAGELLVLELENVAVAAPDAHEVGHELGDRRIPEGGGRPVEMARRRDEAVLDRRHLLLVAQIGGLDEDSEKEIRFGAQLQRRLQRDEIVVGERAERAPRRRQLALVGGRSIASVSAKAASSTIGTSFSASFSCASRNAPTRVARSAAIAWRSATDRARRSRFSDMRPAVSLSFAASSPGSAGHRVVERGARGIDRLERARALVRAGGGEQCLRGGRPRRPPPGDVGGARHVRQARAGDDLERAPEAIVRDERGARSPAP